MRIARLALFCGLFAVAVALGCAGESGEGQLRTSLVAARDG